MDVRRTRKVGEHKRISLYFLFIFLFVFGNGVMIKKSKKKKRRSAQKTKEMTIKMISTIQWSVFTIANPMPVCFAER